MSSAQLIREARLRAGLTQAELSVRLGVPQSTVARWERGKIRPSLERTLAALRACDLDLVIRVIDRDEPFEDQIDRQQGLTVPQRMAQNVHMIEFIRTARAHIEGGDGHPPKPYRPMEILAALEHHGVRYVVTGGLASVLRGSPYASDEIDITPAAESKNLAALRAALRELHTPEPLDNDEGKTYSTRAGELNVCPQPRGTGGYRDLSRSATREPLTATLTVSVASLADVVRGMEAAGRESDQRVLPALRQVLERHDR